MTKKMDLKKKLSDSEIFLKIFQYIDKLFNMIKPRNYFFMAVDGVAPRAKMNQQRSRRFRSALDAEKIKQEAISTGKILPEEKDIFDSNCITPGTQFMHNLSLHLKYFIIKKIEEDLNWKNCKIIYSGFEAPGEGEHKIMQFIRGRKVELNYNPNETHCLYGLDADLIMLSLVVHEPHFIILREKIFSNDKKYKNYEVIFVSLIREQTALCAFLIVQADTPDTSEIFVKVSFIL